MPLLLNVSVFLSRFTQRVDRLIAVAAICSFCSFSLLATEGGREEKKLARKIQAHLTIHDYPSAVIEAQESLYLYPDSPILHEGYIRSLAMVGDEKKLVQAWEKYASTFPDKSLNRELIEEMAWGILQKASHSSSILMRDMALLAAYFSHDAKGVTILLQGLRDSNYAVRAVAAKLAGQLRDHRLTEEIRRLFYEEKTWAVRQQVIQAVGKMKILQLKGKLEELIASDESLAVEKALAIASLLELLDEVSRIEVQKLAASNRAGLRQLASQVIAHFHSMRDLDLLLSLAKDSHPEVRFEAYQAIGKLRPRKESGTILALARSGIQEANHKAALSAAWLLTLYSPAEGQQAIASFFSDKRREVRLLAAGALCATGPYGVTLMLDQFRSDNDPLVRLNLALGLVKQRQAPQEAAAYIQQMLMKKNEKWVQMEVGVFEAIATRCVVKGEEGGGDAEIDNQLLRLRLLNLLAILKVPGTEEAIRRYLSERTWEISASAALTLLMEGDESAGEAVQQLLHDSHPRVRLQAALVLSLWGRDERAIHTLEQGYFESEWEMKARILEGVGRIGATQSIPFLIQVLKEPSQTLRLIAAMALIQCLNH